MPRAKSGPSSESVSIVILQVVADNGVTSAHRPRRAATAPGRCVDDHLDAMPAARRSTLNLHMHVLGDIVEGRPSLRERYSGARYTGDAIDAKGPPVVAFQVVGDEIPAATERNEPERLDHPATRVPVQCPVVDADAFGVATAEGKGRQHLVIDQPA